MSSLARISTMEYIKHHWRRFWGAVALTTQQRLSAATWLGAADIDMEQYIRIHEHFWTGKVRDYVVREGREEEIQWQGGNGEEEISEENLTGEADGEPLCPNATELRDRWSPRTRRFMRYWVAKVYERFPNVIGDFSPSATGCTRKWLCEQLAKGRPGRGPLHMWQRVAVVDKITALAHIGTQDRLMLDMMLEASKPTWYERLLGLRRAAVG